MIPTGEDAGRWLRSALLADLAKRPSTPVESLVRVCAWCEEEKPEDERMQGDNVTHGICGRHSLELRARLMKVARDAR